MKAKTRHWFIYQQPCFRFHIFAIHLIGVRIMPLTGRDVISSQRTSLQTLFQSTRPARGATVFPHSLQCSKPEFQSTRPLRGATYLSNVATRQYSLFQSTRPLRGATCRPSLNTEPTMRFQSTRPLRGATAAGLLPPLTVEISIHAPLAGRDPI